MAKRGRPKGVGNKLKVREVGGIPLRVVPGLEGDHKHFPQFWRCTAKQRAFVLQYVAGEKPRNRTWSYIQAGYGGVDVYQGAYRTFHNAGVQAAIREISEAFGVDPIKVAQRINEQVAGADVADFEPYLKGEKTLDELREMGVNTGALSEANEYEDSKGVTRRTIKLAPPVPTLRLGAEVAGMIRHRIEVDKTLTVNFADINEAQLKRLAYDKSRTLLGGTEQRAIDANFTVNPDGSGTDREAGELVGRTVPRDAGEGAVATIDE